MAALAHGLPVVTTTGRLSESFWKDSGSIVAMPSNDASRISRAVIELAGQPERRIRLGQAARNIYETRFSLDHVIHALRNDMAVACQ
jgi:glycosyltransferase involved in cell wall biosynthesis